MNYNKVSQISNVTISDYSPRASGETEIRSEWKQVALTNFTHETKFAARAALIEKLAGEHAAVWMRVSTNGHRARLYVRN